MKQIMYFLICFIVFAQPIQSFAQDEKVLDIVEVKADNGITAWLVEDHSLPIIAINFAFIGAGATLDPIEKQGLVRLASNTMDEGAGDMDSATFQKKLRDNNISLSFNSTRDNFQGSLQTLTKNKTLAFNLMKLALNEPRFDPDPIERMRAANIARIKSSVSDPNWKAARLLNDITYEGHPYAMNSGGTITSLKNITADDLKNFTKNSLAKENLRIGVVGDISAEELKLALNEIFGTLPDKANLPERKQISIQNTGATVLYEHDIPQTIIEIAQNGIGRDHPDYYTSVVMNHIFGGSGFGSRLTNEVREKRGLTYGIYSYFSDKESCDSFHVSTSTKNESVAQVIDIIKSEISKIKDTPVSDTELETAKKYLIGSFPLSLSSTVRISRILMKLQLDDLPINYLDLRKERINAVTKTDIQVFSKNHMTPDKLTTVLVGKPEGVTPTRIAETLPNVE